MSLLKDPRVNPQEAEIVERFTSSVPVRVAELASELGLKVTRTAMPPKFSGLIQPCVEARSGFEIRVNKFDAPDRQRFTVAHEIAHFLLHRHEIGAGVVDSIMYRSTLTSRKETEANQLAADIVMPAQGVRRELSKLGSARTDEAAERMAGVFRVSVPAMKIRLGMA